MNLPDSTIGVVPREFRIEKNRDALVLPIMNVDLCFSEVMAADCNSWLTSTVKISGVGSDCFVSVILDVGLESSGSLFNFRVTATLEDREASGFSFSKEVGEQYIV